MLPKKFEQEEVFMNTRINIQVFSDLGTVKTKEKLQEAFRCFDYVVKKYTRFDPKSELSKLNNSGGMPHKVSKELFELIEYMLELAKETNGAYDPTIIDLLESYGYKADSDFTELDDPKLYENIQKLIKARPSPSEIKLDKKNLTLTLAKRQRIDLGSIGKGYAIDLAYEKLKDTHSFMINAGGDIRVKGPKPDGNPWTISLYYAQLPNKKLHKDMTLGNVELNQGSICGSGGWARKVRYFHHLLNPKTGIPINEISQTYVQAPTAMEADAWATVLFVTGKAGLKLIKNPIKGIIVNSSGDLFKSP